MYFHNPWADPIVKNSTIERENKKNFSRNFLPRGFVWGPRPDVSSGTLISIFEGFFIVFYYYNLVFYILLFKENLSELQPCLGNWFLVSRNAGNNVSECAFLAFGAFTNMSATWQNCRNPCPPYSEIKYKWRCGYIVCACYLHNREQGWDENFEVSQVRATIVCLEYRFMSELYFCNCGVVVKYRQPKILT